MRAFWRFAGLAALALACGSETSRSPRAAGNDELGGSAGTGSGASATVGGQGGTGASPVTVPGGAAGEGGAGGVDDGTSIVEIGEPPELLADFEELSSQLAVDATLTSEQLLAQYQVAYEQLNYAPLESVNLGLIQASPLSLTSAELDALGLDGFVISDRQSFPTFVYGYTTLYSADLPVYVSADSLLDALHRSYDLILERLEVALLRRKLVTFLSALRAGLSAAPEQPGLADLDVYLTVASSLFEGHALSPAAGGDTQLISQLVQQVNAAAGTAEVELFGDRRLEDFSQFTPRGHYTNAALIPYFKTMMWLGRVDFRLIETDGGGGRTFRRPQYDAMLTLHSLMNAEARSAYDVLDSAISLFVGESDYMTPLDVQGLVDDLGGLEGARAATDEQAANAIVAGGYGVQRIASHLIQKLPSAGSTLPLNTSFAVLGQRYVLDSHVFSNVVWDRTEAKRMMPDPLDVAFAALGNDAAVALLEDQLTTYQYAGNLMGMRRLADAHEPEYWDLNLYNIWFSGARALSSRHAGLPNVASTEPWARRILNTQLATWAQLRHDTLLYAKQSYTTGDICEFPDAYVDPYPEFYAAIRRFADKGASLAQLLTPEPVDDNPELAVLKTELPAYFQRLSSVAQTLQEMAEYQLQGTPFTDAHMAFINRTVTWSPGCGSPESGGWYSELFYESGAAVPYDPTIADVHTNPDGDDVSAGHVLHVGTGGPRLMVVTVDTCQGPRAYAGLAFSYHELVTANFKRMTDEDWSFELENGNAPPTVPWLADLIVP